MKQAGSMSIYLGEYQKDLLRALAEKDDRSLSYIVAVAIQKMAAGNEWPDSGLDDEVLKEIKKKHGFDDARGR